MALKPLEPGDSVRVKQNIIFKLKEAEVYIDGKLIELGKEDLPPGWWLVEYELADVKHQDYWHESDITSKHYARVTDDNYFDKAEKISAEDYSGVLFYDDYFFESVEEVLEHWENIADEDDEPPKYVWACDTTPVKLQLNLADMVTEQLEEDGYEGMSDRTQFAPLYDRLSELEKDFIELAAKEIVSYPNYKKAVIL